MIFEILNRVIITGGNGFIGRHLIKKILSSQPCSIILISNSINSDDKLAEQAKPVILYWSATF